ncbi:hypothetical protein HBH98_212510 [Parastagonospora nodorum]|nr:hypothetical protein HBH52_191780 [Parastagonospora nodorum]KAH4216622.1 hypothetical protein HBI06_227940 [Parastagonospora nodorum]KAH4232176.1 hypothetical protein HBI05_175240 [Parastagonospora nodorum]KAH4251719.1 hypothetical protein HBI03_219780 [Parastagonospora nodorum]KAH4262675.1 hypothetical protein HBI04_195310 [Parastagonospora nodorum]
MHMMSLSKLGVFANLALAASAVLLPPTITAADLEDDHVFEGLVVDPFARSAALECPTCAVASWDPEQDKMSWKENAGNTFHVQFQIGGDKDTLKTNDYQLFPPSMNQGFPSFYVVQNDPVTEEPMRLLVTSYTFRYNGAQTVSEEGTELLPMTMQISSVEGVDVNPPVLTINVLKDTSGRLMIASFDTTEVSDAPLEEALSQDTNCNEWPLLCKWKGIVAERIEKMKKMGKGCHKRPHNPMAEETFHGKPPHRFRPGHGHPHHQPEHMSHGHHHHEHMHVFARRTFFTIFIPIVVGIFAGTVTYLVGMVLGTMIAILIARIRGQEYQPIALGEEDVEEGRVEEETDVKTEKQDYAELPAYDAPPVYEEATGEEVDESK